MIFSARLTAFCFVGGLLWSALATAQNTRVLNLIVNAPARTPAGSQLFFTGSAETGCNWQPDCRPLQVIDSVGNSFSVQLELPNDVKSFEFKITRGSWETEAADPDGNALSNEIVNMKGHSGIHVLSVVNWKDLGGLGVTGTVVDLGPVYSPELQNSREVYVWLPPSYSQNVKKRYPVLYMHDGQNLFDPKTATYGVDWDIDDAMTRIAHETGEEAIVVGAACDPEPAMRSHEYDYAYKGEAYANFLINTLKPKIDSQFLTRPEREATFVGGSSMGALISVELVWAHPEIFSKAMAFSLPADVHNNSIFSFIDSVPKPWLPFSLYIDHGGWGEDRNYKKPVLDFIAALKKKGVTDQQISYAQFPYHDHTEADWSRRVEPVLRWLLK